MWDLLRKDVIVEMLDAHIAKILDKDTAFEGLSKRTLTLNPFMEPI